MVVEEFHTEPTGSEGSVWNARVLSHPNSSEMFFSVTKVPCGTIRNKRSTQCLEFKLLLIAAKNRRSAIMYA